MSSILCFGMTPPSSATRRSTSPVKSCSQTPPVLISDVLGTLVRDPFNNGMAAYFGFDSMDKFIAAKTPNLWVDFELGKIDEETLARDFFLDKTPVDLNDLKAFLMDNYQLLPGVSEMLVSLRDAQVPVHLCTNYPLWAQLIEDSLRLVPRFGLKWTFVSALEGVRKPHPDAYLRVAQKANVPPSSCVLLDDREDNCAGALQAGFLDAILFENASHARLRIREVFSNNNTTLQI